MPLHAGVVIKRDAATHQRNVRLEKAVISILFEGRNPLPWRNPCFSNIFGGAARGKRKASRAHTVHIASSLTPKRAKARRGTKQAPFPAVAASPPAPSFSHLIPYVGARAVSWPVREGDCCNVVSLSPRPLLRRSPVYARREESVRL